MTGRDVHRTARWRGVVAVALVAVAVGLVLRRPNVVLLAVVGVAYAVYPAVTSAPEPSLAIERRLSDETPAAGDEVSVTVTLRNEGERPLSDLRVVDGVPATLAVTDGSPRHAGVLRAGSELTYSYDVVAERGKHPFEPATVVARDLSGEREVEATVATETEIDCTATETAAPLRRETLAVLGEVLSSRGGSGVEFHRSREYRRGDPTNRIDWKHYARTGEFVTTEFRQERAASVVLLIDARETAYRGPSSDPHGVSLSVSAARQFVETLLGSRNLVGVAGVGRGLVWRPPGAGRDHADGLQATLTTNDTFASTPPHESADHDAQVDRLLDHLDERTQVLFLSPLCDDGAVDLARTLDVQGHAVSVCSPSVTDDGSPGQRLAAVERRQRVAALRNAELPVVEWDPQRPLTAAVAEATSRRGRSA